MIATPGALLFWLLVGHALADYPLQGDFLARAKNHRNPTRAANGQAFPWWIALAMHALMHAGAVALVTRSVGLGLVEFVAHVAIDYQTSAGRFGYVADQVAHVATKLLIVAFLFL